MAFAVTDYRAYGLYIDEPVTTRAHQVLVLKATGAVGDVALDLNTDGGTFWTAAIADGTYGAVAVKALAALDSIKTVADAVVSFSCPEIQWVKQQIDASTAVATKQYKITTSGLVPSIAIFAGEGSLTYTIVLVWALKREARAIRANV